MRDLEEAIALVNDSPYGLTSAIHTASLHRAMRFADEVEAGVVVVNGGTHGSEPHMGFGGVKQSGTGWREAGIEALDVYTEWKYVNLIADPGEDVIRPLWKPRHTLVTVSDPRPWPAGTVGATARSARIGRFGSSRRLDHGTVSDAWPWVFET